MAASTTTTMKAWQYSTVATTLEDALTLNPSAEGPTKASLGKNELLIEVVAAALNPVDYKLAELGFVGGLVIKKPATPAQDFCGRVVAMHSTANGFKEGQLVFGQLPPGAHRYGALGEFLVASTRECAPVPDGVDAVDAAAAGTVGLTAYQSLYVGTATKPGAKVFINGGSGGTGTFGIQIAKALGAEVWTSCSTANVGLCKELGADEVLDYKSVSVADELAKRGQVFDLAVDNVGTPGSDLYSRSGEYLKPGAVFAQVGMEMSRAGMLSAVHRLVRPGFLGGGKRPFRFIAVSPKPEDLAAIGKWMAEGKVKAVIDETFEMEDVPKAYKKLRTGRTRGKIVVRVKPQSK